MLDHLLLEGLVVQLFVQDYVVILELVDPLEGSQLLVELQLLVVQH